MTSAKVQCLSGQALVSEFEPSFLKEGHTFENRWSPKENISAPSLKRRLSTIIR